MKQFQCFSKTVLLSSIFAVVAMTTTATQAKQYYKWVDSKGSTHYTTTPPPSNARSKSKVSTYGYRGGSAPAAPQSTQPAPAQNAQPTNQQNNNQQNNQQTGQATHQAANTANNQSQNTNQAAPQQQNGTKPQ